MITEPPIYDYAIIGAGPAGSYIARELLSNPKRYGIEHPSQVAVFEELSDPGGRLESYHVTHKEYKEHFPGSFELGGMRYSEESHPTVTRVIKELGACLKTRFL